MSEYPFDLAPGFQLIEVETGWLLQQLVQGKHETIAAGATATEARQNADKIYEDIEAKARQVELLRDVSY